jgi:hypothetical protein
LWCIVAGGIIQPGCSSKVLTTTAPEILARIRLEHPRLMMTPGTVASIKADLAVNPWLRKRYERQKERADRFLNEPAGSYDLKGTDRLLDTSRRAFDRVATLALVYRIAGDSKYLDRCWSELAAAARFPDWDPLHFLSTAEMTAAFAVGYDWLYDAWTEAQRQTIRQAIVQLGLRPGLAAYHSGKYARRAWPTWNNNWNIVCITGLALGALAVAPESHEIAGEVLVRGLSSIPISLSRFAPDGGWGEGPMYWENASLFAAMYLDSFQTACGAELTVGDLTGLGKCGWFPLYMNGPAGGAFNFADAMEDPDPRAGPQLFWLARRFHEPRYAEYEMEVHSGRKTALELIWGAGIEHRPWQTMEPDHYFRGVEVATMRDSWNDPRSWFVGFNGGSDKIDHAHLDAGSFVLEAKGVRWVIDLGPDDYDLPGYSHDYVVRWMPAAISNWTGQRWTYYRLRAEAHNTVAIDPGIGPDQDPRGEGKITSFNTSQHGVELSADLTAVYPAAERVLRSLSFARGKGVKVHDVIQLRHAGEIWWFLQSRALVKPSANGRALVLSQGGETLNLVLLEPESARFEIGPAVPLATSPHPPKQGANPGVTRIAIHLRQARDTSIAVLFQ